ncbi:MAG: hypothetical protein WDO69_02790 [Pseudomonadota bacterium]
MLIFEKGLFRAPARSSIRALMAVEFALRPRIRLREDPAPARRARPRLPKFALPALAYWLVIGGLVYAFVHHHDASAPPAGVEAALEPTTPPPRPVVREWWRPTPAPASPPSPPIAERPTTPEARETLAAPVSEALLAEPSAPEAAHAPDPDRTLRPPRTPDPALRPAAHALPSDPDPVPPLSPAPAPSPVAGGLPSCEAALASASQDVDFSGGNRAADLPTRAIAAVLENGAWLSSCAVPEHTALDVCVAIKGGHVVGATVTARPADSALGACVRRRASSLQFPYSPRLDLARTRF